MKKIFALALWASTTFFSTSHARDAKQVLDTSGVKGGLVVVIGVDDPAFLTGLKPNDSYLVHGLDTDKEKVDRARKRIQERGVYGKVSVDQFNGNRLPYVRDLVNLLVARDLGEIPLDEIRRVLAPNGVAMIRRGETWERTVEPRPPEIDEWSHFLHDASGNAVANDEKIGPPKRLRWVGGPRWCRTHEFPSSVGAVVSAGGRVFTIFDEGQTGIYKKLPQRCKLIARDAASGVLLWKVPLREWQPEFGTGLANRWGIHHTIPRRLVAAGDRVYVTLRFLASPVSVLDAATGKILTPALEGTKGADEIILSDGVLVSKCTKKRSVAATARFGKNALDDTLVAVDVQTGKQLWRKESTRVVPYALSAANGRVVYHDMDALVCLDARTGDERWRSANPIASTVGGGSTLVISGDVVLFHGHEQTEAPVAADADKADKKGKKAKKGKKKKRVRNRFTLTARSLNEGSVLWTHPGRRGQAGACTQPTDLFVVDGIVWCGGALQGRALRTGEIVKTLSIDKLISPGHHYRCHRSKATSRYLIWPKRGAEFLDVRGDDHMRCDWLRAPCFTGATPANGLFYAPPSQCFCYPGVKVSGFLAMASEPAEELRAATAANLDRGDAFDQRYQMTDSERASAEDWPVYRHDARRTGSTPTNVPAKLSKQWEVELACPGSPPVIVRDRVWVAEKDLHRIRCLRATDGKDAWRFTAGARIDSPPSVHEGLVLFGSTDGAVYCLRATDGALVWRFRAAPNRRLMSFEQLESVWPVHGSVLVQNGVVYFAAGRSSFLDGGILVYGLEAKTGKVLYHTRLEGPWPDIKRDVGRPFAMEGALPDLLVSDGKNLYMQRIKFDAKLNRLETKRESPLGELDMGADHLVATGGFLDDTGFDRVYWMHTKRWPGFYFSQHAPKSGQLVVFDDNTTYAVKYFYRRIQWSPVFHPAERGYLLFADHNDTAPMLDEKGQKSLAVRWLPREAYSDKHKRGGRGSEKGTGYIRHQPPKWQKMIPVRVRAMVLAGGHLFVAGPPDVVEEKDPYAAFDGRKGAALQTFSASGGALLETHPLAAPPVFDGMAAANGKLYLSDKAGRIMCFGPRKE